MCVINTGLLQNDIKFRYNDFTLRERGHIKDFVLHKNEILAGEEIFVLCHLLYSDASSFFVEKKYCNESVFFC